MTGLPSPVLFCCVFIWAISVTSGSSLTTTAPTCQWMLNLCWPCTVRRHSPNPHPQGLCKETVQGDCACNGILWRLPPLSGVADFVRRACHWTQLRTAFDCCLWADAKAGLTVPPLLPWWQESRRIGRGGGGYLSSALSEWHDCVHRHWRLLHTAGVAVRSTSGGHGGEQCVSFDFANHPLGLSCVWQKGHIPQGQQHKISTVPGPRNGSWQVLCRDSGIYAVYAKHVWKNFTLSPSAQNSVLNSECLTPNTRLLHLRTA